MNFLFVSLTTTSVPQITKDGAAAATCPDSLVTPVGCSVASDGYDIEKKKLLLKIASVTMTIRMCEQGIHSDCLVQKEGSMEKSHQNLSDEYNP